MSDLISRSDVNDVIDELEVYTCGRLNTMKVEVSVLQLQRFINKLKNIPTAYSVGKVVDELEENASRYTKKYLTPYGNNGYRDVKAISIHKAIEIVKKGGVSDDMCEWEKDEHSENDNPAEWIICPHKPKRIFSKDIKYCPYCGKKIKVAGD